MAASRRTPATRLEGHGAGQSGHTVVVQPNFDWFGGRYVFHCHASEHSDMSMIGQMEVVA